MPAETWAALINHYYKPPQSLFCDGTKLLNAVTRTKWFNTAISTTGVIDDELSLYRNRHRPKGGKQIYCFYAAPNGVKPTVKEQHWFNYINYAEDLLQIKTTRTKTLVFKDTKTVQEEQEVHTRKRKRPQNQEICEPGLSEATSLGDTTDPLKINEVSSSVLSVTSVHPHASQATEDYYWHSTEAAKLFLPTPGESNCLVAVDNQICLLEDSLASPLSYLNIVDIMGEVDGDPSEVLSSYQVWVLRQKCQILLCALKVAKLKMPKLQNWDIVCAEALDIVRSTGVSTTKASRVVRNYYQEFRVKRKFQARVAGKHNLPPFLEQNKEVCTSLQQYAREHLSELSVELICEYLHDMVIPKMVKDASGVEKSVNEELHTGKAKEILKEYGLTCIDPSTIYRWLQKLGFRYEPRRKGYYVDGHEKPATIEYRKQFITRYLSYEQRAHRWIQISLSEAVQLEEKNDSKK